jgi:hypothetical protein
MDVSNLSSTGFTVIVSDVNFNSMPTGSTISAVKLGGRSTCSVTQTLPGSILNTYGPTAVVVSLDQCGSGDRIGVTVTTPGIAAAPTTTPLSITLP